MNRLVVALDGSNTSEVALGWAVELASLASATITVVIVDQGPAATGSARAQELGAFALRICGRAGVTATASVSLGDPTEVLVEQSESLDAGLVVVGAPGPRSQTWGEKRHLSDELARHIDRPLALVPPTARPGVRRIILGVGPGSTSGTIIQAAADLAPLVGADVVAVHALCPPSQHGEGGELGDALRRQVERRSPHAHLGVDGSAARSGRARGFAARRRPGRTLRLEAGESAARWRSDRRRVSFSGSR